MMRSIVVIFAVSGWISQLCHGFSPRHHVLYSRPAKTAARRMPPPLSEGYVPDGLSPEEYQNIKKKEAARLKSMNFGAFGPRFLKSSNQRPQGDWMLMPSLWTGGYSNRRDRTNRYMSNNGNDNKIASLFAGIKSFFKTWGPALFLSYLCIDVGIAMEVSTRLAETKPRQIITTMLKVFIWAKRQNMWLVWWKAQTVKCAATLVMAWPVQKWIDFAERKWSWSRKKTVLVTSSLLVGGSLSYSVLLLILRKYGLLGG